MKTWLVFPVLEGRFSSDHHIPLLITFHRWSFLDQWRLETLYSLVLRVRVAILAQARCVIGGLVEANRIQARQRNWVQVLVPTVTDSVPA